VTAGISLLFNCNGRPSTPTRLAARLSAWPPTGRHHSTCCMVRAAGTPLQATILTGCFVLMGRRGQDWFERRPRDRGLGAGRVAGPVVTLTPTGCSVEKLRGQRVRVAPHPALPRSRNRGGWLRRLDDRWGGPLKCGCAGLSTLSASRMVTLGRRPATTPRKTTSSTPAPEDFDLPER
jgi:hypothetical protein